MERMLALEAFQSILSCSQHCTHVQDRCGLMAEHKRAQRPDVPPSLV